MKLTTNNKIDQLKDLIRRSEHIFFEPSIGSRYLDGINGMRVLVVGLNHYCKNKDCNCSSCPFGQHMYITKESLLKRQEYAYIQCIEWTSSEVENWENIKSYKNFNKRMSKVLALDDFWQHVAFYNFIQTAPSESSSKAIHSGWYEYGKIAFKELIEILKPDKIIVWGWGVWCNIPCDGWVDKGYIEGIPYGGYDNLECSADIIRVIHPSPISNGRTPDNEPEIMNKFFSL